jgi:hypothetical protein
MTDGATSDAQSPGDGGEIRGLQEFLKAEDCKLALQSLSDLSGRQRSSRLALFSACGFVALTTLGFARELHGLEDDLSRAEVDAGRTRAAREAAEHKEQESFALWNQSQMAAEAHAANLPVQSAALDRVKEQVDAKRQEAAERAHVEDQRRLGFRAAANDKVRTLADQLSAAQQQGAEARRAIADFRKRDADDRSELDFRRDPVPEALRRRGDEADKNVEQLQHDLKQAREAARDAATSKPDSPSANMPDELAAGRSTYWTQISELANAKIAAARANGEWLEASRAKESTVAIASEAEKRVADLKERRTRNTLTLPVISVPLQPAVFFRAAPLLLVAIVLDGAFIAANLAITLRWLEERARVAKIAGDLEALVEPLRRGSRTLLWAVAPLIVVIGTMWILVSTWTAPIFTALCLLAVVFAAVYEARITLLRPAPTRVRKANVLVDSLGTTTKSKEPDESAKAEPEEVQ